MVAAVPAVLRPATLQARVGRCTQLPRRLLLCCDDVLADWMPSPLQCRFLASGLGAAEAAGLEEFHMICL